MHSFRRRSVDQCGLVHGKCGSSVWDRQGPGQLRHNESRPKHPPIRARLPASAKACGRTAGIASLRQTRPARQTCRRLRGTGCLSASCLFYGDSGSPSLPPGQGAHHRVHRRRPVRDCAYARASTSDRAAACPRSEESPRPARSWRISDWHLRCRDVEFRLPAPAPQGPPNTRRIGAAAPPPAYTWPAALSVMAYCPCVTSVKHYSLPIKSSARNALLNVRQHVVANKLRHANSKWTPLRPRRPCPIGD